MFVTNIQRFSLDDGPGIRTTLFLSGCNMKCLWCHNPETFQTVMLGYEPDQCAGCRSCEKVCKNGAHTFFGASHQIKWNQCGKCFQCVKACGHQALFRNSKEMAVKEVISEIEKDMRFYKRSSGGVTFSGGEPLLQRQELQGALRECKKRGIHTAVDTAGNYPFDWLGPLLDDIDVVLMDCKAYTEEVHIKCTGCSNQQILGNIQWLSNMGKNMWIRIPVIWNVNVTLDEMEKIAGFLKGKRIGKVELLPYHKMGVSKYKTYGQDYLINEALPAGKGEIGQCYEVLKRHQIPVSDE